MLKDHINNKWSLILEANNTTEISFIHSKKSFEFMLILKQFF